MVLKQKVYRVFISSTFRDFSKERDALQEIVFPRLKQLCATRGAHFEPIDLRWGISNEAGLSQRAVRICLNEIARCQNITESPNFILLLGDRYGWQPIPETIPTIEFDTLKRFVADQSMQKQLMQWYKLDENANPAEYVLQPRIDGYTTWDKWEPVEIALRKALHNAVKMLSWTIEIRLKYETSVTEQEIFAGIFNYPIAHKSAFCFIRTIEGLPDTKNDYYEDDEDAQDRLTSIRHELDTYLPSKNIHRYTAQWHDDDLTDSYIKDFCIAVYEKLSQSILDELNEAKEMSDLQVEQEQQSQFLASRRQQFVGRTNILGTVKQYLKDENSFPLVLYGRSGIGKTTVIAEVIRSIDTNVYKPIYRFIGASPTSTDISQLLRSISEEIKEYYSSRIDIPFNYEEMIEVFPQILTLATKERPLIIFLDALDQLTSSNNPSNLRWMPQELPDHVRIVVSLIPGKYLSQIRRRIPNCSSLELKEMSSEEGDELLNLWLDTANRRLTEYQREYILSRFRISGLPLYLKLAFEEARLWHSYTDNYELAWDVPALIKDNLFARLRHPLAHGEILVSRSISYLITSRNGLTEREIVKLLADDDEYWDAFKSTAHKGHRLVERRVPDVVWSRLILDLEPYLVELKLDGYVLLSFYHHQFEEVVASLFTGDEVVKKQRHESLASYFHRKADPHQNGNWHEGSLRALAELPYHLVRCHAIKKLHKLFSDLGFLSRTCKNLDIHIQNDGTINYGGVVSLLQHLGDAVKQLRMAGQGADDRHRELHTLLNMLTDRSKLLTRYPEMLSQEIANYINLPSTIDFSVSLLERAQNTLKNGFRLQNKEKIQLAPGGHTGAITALASSPGKPHCFVSGGADGSVCYWQIGHSRYLWHRNDHQSWITAVAVSESGQFVASASYDGRVSVWDAELGTLLSTFSTRITQQWAPVQYVYFLDEDMLLLSYGISWVGTFDLNSEEFHSNPELAALGADMTRGAMEPAIYDFWRSGKLMVVYRDQEKCILVSRVDDGSTVARIPTVRRVRTVAFIDQGRKVFFTDAQGMLSVYDIASEQLVEGNLESPLLRCHSSSDLWAVDTQQNLLRIRFNDGLKVDVWDVLQKLQEPSVPSVFLFLAESQSLIVGLDSASIIQWNMQTHKTYRWASGGKLIKGAIFPLENRGVAVHSDREHSASADYEGESLVLIDPSLGTKRRIDTPHQHFITGVASINANSFVTVDRLGTAVFWKNSKPIQVTQFPDTRFTGCSHLKGTNKAILGTHNGQVIIWDGQSKEHIPFAFSELALGTVSTGITAIDGNRHGIAVTYYIELIRYSGQGRNWILPHAGGEHSHQGNSISISSDGYQVADGNIVGEIRIWDTEHGTLKAQLKLHDGAINALVFNQNSMYLYSAGKDQVLYAIDVQTLKPKYVTMLPAPILAIIVEQDESIVALDNAGNIFQFHLQ